MDVEPLDGSPVFGVAENNVSIVPGALTSCRTAALMGD